jgi:hypothetical protein
MRRITITPPAEVLERIREMAAAERRTPKEQIEYILIEHIRGREKVAPAEVANV